jgi:hypothetical protein
MDDKELDQKIASIVDAAEQQLKIVEGFSKRDVKTAMRWLNNTLILLWLNEFPILSKKYVTVLRTLANILEQRLDVEKEED